MSEKPKKKSVMTEAELDARHANKMRKNKEGGKILVAT